MTLDKQSHTFPAIESIKHLCRCCDEFDPTRYREVANSKGYCEARNMILYRTDPSFCIDFKEVISAITKELKE